MAITVPAAMCRAAHRKLLRPPDPAGRVQNHQRRNQQHGGELRDQRQSDCRRGRQQAPRTRFLQVLHPKHAGEKEKHRDREIRRHIAAVRHQIRVERAQSGRRQAGRRPVPPARPPCHRGGEQQSQQNIGAARRNQNRIGIAPVLIQEIDAVPDLIFPLAVRSVRLRGEAHQRQRQGADHFHQRRMFHVPGIIPELQIRIARHNVDALVPRLGFAPRRTHFERAHNRQNRSHGRPKRCRMVIPDPQDSNRRLRPDKKKKKPAPTRGHRTASQCPSLAPPRRRQGSPSH